MIQRTKNTATDNQDASDQQVELSIAVPITQLISRSPESDGVSHYTDISEFSFFA
jgi:hypothetical protein